ncbi:MAG TPA: hypothetical protein VGH03_03660 [Caulobacteraceae bacterium]|jgi:hypothetical protein
MTAKLFPETIDVEAAPAALRKPVTLGDRPLCFLHIAKTGGTSVTDALARLFPPDRVFTDNGNLSVEYLEKLGERFAGRIFLAGHATAGVAEFLQDRADLITVLRRPADQAVSNYLHVLSDPENGLHAEAARGSFSDFLRRNDHQIDYQLGALCSALARDSARGHELRTRDLDIVLRFVDDLPFVGVMERAEACGEVLSRVIPDAGDLRLACLNSAVYRGISVRTLDLLRSEYETLKGDPRLAPIFAREARVHARAEAALARLELRLAQPGDRSVHGWTGAIGASRFSTRNGEILGSAIVCRLPEGAEHVVHGPYDRFPVGCYSVEFRFSVRGVAPGPSPRVQIEAVSNGVVSLRRRWVGAEKQSATRTLHFINDAASNVLEFRIRTRGFTNGRFVFEGATVRPSTLWRAWPSVLTRLLSRARWWRGRRIAPAQEPQAAIPIEARARTRWSMSPANDPQ